MLLEYRWSVYLLQGGTPDWIKAVLLGSGILLGWGGVFFKMTQKQDYENSIKGH